MTKAKKKELEEILLKRIAEANNVYRNHSHEALIALAEAVKALKALQEMYTED